MHSKERTCLKTSLVADEGGGDQSEKEKKIKVNGFGKLIRSLNIFKEWNKKKEL